MQTQYADSMCACVVRVCVVCVVCVSVCVVCVDWIHRCLCRVRFPDISRRLQVTCLRFWAAARHVHAPPARRPGRPANVALAFASLPPARKGIEFRVQGLGFRGWGLDFRISATCLRSSCNWHRRASSRIRAFSISCSCSSVACLWRP